MEALFFSSLPEISKRHPKTYNLQLLPLAISRSGMQVPIIEEHPPTHTTHNNKQRSTTLMIALYLQICINLDISFAYSPIPCYLNIISQDKVYAFMKTNCLNHIASSLKKALLGTLQCLLTIISKLLISKKLVC